jgi:hypothetical protein
MMNSRMWCFSAAWLAPLIGSMVIAVSDAQGQAGWSGAQSLGHVGYRPEEGVRLAGNARGDAAVVWQAPDGSLRLARAWRGGPFGSSRSIARSADGRPFVAMDDQGDLIVAWNYSDNALIVPPDAREGPSCCDRVRVAVLRADGRLVLGETLTSRKVSADVSAVAISAGGSTVAVLYEAAVAHLQSPYPRTGTPHLFVRTAQFGKPFGRSAGFGFARLAALRASHREVSVVYGSEREPPAPFYELGAGKAAMAEARVSLTGRRLDTRSLGDLGYKPNGILNEDVSSMQFGYDAHGDLAALFAGGQHKLVMAALRVGGGLRAQGIHTVPEPPRDRGFYAPDLAIAPSGRGIITWSGGYSRDQIGVAIGSLPSDRFRLAAVLTPLPPGRAVQNMDDAINSRGQAAIVLTASGPGGEEHDVLAILRSACGHFERPIVLAGFGDLEGETNPQVAIDTHGRGVVTWESSSNELVARRFQAP